MAFNNNPDFMCNSVFRNEKSMMPLGETNFGTQKKRKIEDDIHTKENRYTYFQEGMLAAPVMKEHYPRNFVKIPANQWTFQTDEWKNKHTTIHAPLCGDVMINMQTVEQISFDSGIFHTGNEQYIYTESTEGQVIHLWKYDSSLKKLYIYRSFLFTNSQVYDAVQKQLEEL